jgi:hypothetical protein
VTQSPEKLAGAVSRAKEEADAASGAQLLTKDFRIAARDAAPIQFANLTALPSIRAEAVTAQKPPEMPQLHFVATATDK